jgi:hypothetical protein
MTDSIELINYSRDWKNVETNLNKCSIQIVLNQFINDEKFTEEFILNNLEIFKNHINFIVKFKKHLSDEFFNNIFTKNNYSELKMTRKLLEPFRNFKKFDDMYY